MNKANIETVAGWLKGKRRETFLESITALQAAESRGAWEGRESQKSGKGFYAGLKKSRDEDFTFYSPMPPKDLESGYERPNTWPRFEARHCVNYGHAAMAGAEIPQVAGVPYEVVLAWFALCAEAAPLREKLDKARPKPVVTPVGLSPKVTATIHGTGLDLVLSTIAPAELEQFEYETFEKGKVVIAIGYRVKWSDGCKLGKSRFSGQGCEACGKNIPSGMYVPVEVDCKRNGRVGLWLGCDCARNIFGVKDKGIAK